MIVDNIILVSILKYTLGIICYTLGNGEDDMEKISVESFVEVEKKGEMTREYGRSITLSEKDFHHWRTMLNGMR